MKKLNYRLRPLMCPHQKGGLMSQDRETDPTIIKFPSQRISSESSGPSRDELAFMIRKVLSTEELFKMNAPKSRKRISSVEVIDFILPAQEKKDNG